MVEIWVLLHRPEATGIHSICLFPEPAYQINSSLLLSFPSIYLSIYPALLALPSFGTTATHDLLRQRLTRDNTRKEGGVALVKPTSTFAHMNM